MRTARWYDHGVRRDRERRTRSRDRDSRRRGLAGIRRARYDHVADRGLVRRAVQPSLGDGPALLWLGDGPEHAGVRRAADDARERDFPPSGHLGASWRDRHAQVLRSSAARNDAAQQRSQTRERTRDLEHGTPGIGVAARIGATEHSSATHRLPVASPELGCRLCAPDGHGS